MQETPLPSELAALLRRLLPSTAPISPEDSESLPRAGGSYVLLIRLNRNITVSLPRITHVLAPGWYAYAGSARGPGGIAARVGRHLRAGKRIRWHVDRLTEAATALFALPFPGENAPSECALIDRLLHSGAFTAPHAGFGSSDCRVCPAHLLLWRA